MSSEQNRLSELTIRTYNEYSFLPWVVNIVNSSEEKPTRLKFAPRVTIDHWLDPSYIHDMVFYNLARGIGFSERQYVIDAFVRNVDTTSIDTMTPNILGDAAMRLAELGHVPSAIVLPIELYQQVHLAWNTTSNPVLYNPQRWVIAGMELSLFWSSKYNQFKQAFVVSKDFGSWVSYPSAAQRVQVLFEVVGASEMQVTAEARFDFRVQNRDAVTAFTIAAPPPLEVA